jgi:hypothetical protein
MTLAHRAEIIAGADPKDSRAGYPLGILALRGDINEQEHEAGILYAGLHAIVYGGGLTPRSHLASAIAGLCDVLSDLSTADLETMHRRCEKQLRGAVAHILVYCDRHGLSVLENVVVFEQGLRFMDTSNRRPPSAWAADRRDIASLHLALGAIIAEFRIVARRSGERR